MYEIIFSDIAKRQFKKLEKIYQERISAVIERMKIRPEHFVQRLVNSPYYKLRVGEYRLILDIIHEKLIVIIIEMGHRRNIYKK